MPVQFAGVGEDLFELALQFFSSGSLLSDNPVGVFQLLPKTCSGDCYPDELKLSLDERWKVLLSVIKELCVVAVRS